jgi:hypothetical protein
LTVRRLIAALKKMPPSAKVCFAAHDQNWVAGEYDGIVHSVDVVPTGARHHGCGVVLS